MKRLLSDFKRDLTLSASTSEAKARPQPKPLGDAQEKWGLDELEAKLGGTGPTPAETEEQQLQELFDEMSADGSSVDKEGVASIRKEMGLDKALQAAEMEEAMKEMGADNGMVGFQQVLDWWRSTSAQRGPALEDILIVDAQRYSERMGADPALSAPLVQRFTQPSVQPELVRELLPRRKPLIPRMARRSIYSERIVVKPADSGDGSGAKSMKDETERKFDLLELGLEHVPQFYVAEMPDAEEMATRPTPLQLTVTNPLDVACTLRFCDASVAAGLLADSPDEDDSPGDTLPGKHKALGDVEVGVNAQITMVDGNEFSELTVAPKPLGDIGSAAGEDGDAPEDEPSCVVIRNGNRVSACPTPSLTRRSVFQPA